MDKREHDSSEEINQEIEDILPWSPKILVGKHASRLELDEESNSNDTTLSVTTPSPHTYGYYPKRREILEWDQSGEKKEIPELDLFDGSPPPKIKPRQIPWSPQSNAMLENQIAYIFGNIGDMTDSVTKYLKFYLSRDFKVDLILQVSEQPPKPFPLFYLYTDEYPIDKVISRGNETSDGHLIIIKPEEVEIEIPDGVPVLTLPSNWRDNQRAPLKDLCHEMAEQTNQVYETDSPRNGF